jgi:outer membrane protein assembly factor BamA
MRFLCLFLLLPTLMLSQNDTLSKAENIKTGWTFGVLPAVSYNSDLGFQYGGVVNFYHHGDGSNYPKYNHSLFLEISRFTKGSGINRFFYDSEQLLSGLRTTADVSYLTEKALDFYGFNGYDAIYNPEWEDDTHPEYISRVFYRHERQKFKFTFDFQGKLYGDHLRWLAGIGVFNTKIAPVDIDALNKGKDGNDLLPDVPGLYDRYVEWGVIADDEKNGGWNNHLKLGIVYDTRDFEPNPSTGMWSELIFFISPDIAGNDFGYTKLSMTHRQYVPLLPEKKLTLALRGHYQTTIAGNTPFYMQPYLISSFYNAANTDALGGARTLRGVLRNRVVGDGIVMGNAELRWRSNSRMFFNQEFYLGINTFLDTGKAVDKIDLNTSGVPEEEQDEFFKTGAERFHTSAGIGLRVVMNENFIVAVDYGKPFDRRDGKSGLYIGLNYLF